MRAASVAYMTKVCTAMQQCNRPFFDIFWGSLDACIDADASVADLATWFPYGSKLTPASLQLCADSLNFTTCEAFFSYTWENVIPKSQPCHDVNYGMLPNGAPCALFWGGQFSNQCASGHCIPVAGACGQCAAEIPIGGRCNYSAPACAQGSVCTGTSGTTTTCAAYHDVGDACDPSTAPCHPWLVCGADRKCAVPPPDGGCDPTVGCNSLPYPQNCDPTTLHCEDAIAQPGEACGYVAGSPVDFPVYCVAGYTCALDDDAGPDASTYVGHCVPMLAEGQSCDAWEYVGIQNACAFTPLRGDGCNNGKCQFFGPSWCSGAPPPP